MAAHAALALAHATEQARWGRRAFSAARKRVWKIMAESIAGDARVAPFSLAYRWYALGLLFVVYVFNFIDRSILSILAQPIKEELQISDTALGFLGGLAFALFYTALGVPIARLADRSVRRNILAVCLALWSA